MWTEYTVEWLPNILTNKKREKGNNEEDTPRSNDINTEA